MVDGVEWSVVGCMRQWEDGLGAGQVRSLVFQQIREISCYNTILEHVAGVAG